MFSVSFDGNHLLRRFLLERRLFELSGLAQKRRQGKGSPVVPHKGRGRNGNCANERGNQSKVKKWKREKVKKFGSRKPAKLFHF
jgi:hypothetical protein